MNIEIPMSDALDLQQTCHLLGVEQHYLIEIVALGIVEPAAQDSSNPAHWQFDAHMLATLQRACRLCRDLELDWPATALVLELLEEKERLQQENAQLRQHLQRFLHTP